MDKFRDIIPFGDVEKKDRRGMLKLLLFGGGAFVAGKLFGTVTDIFTDKVLRHIEFDNFTFTETEKKLTISEKGGVDLLIVEKKAVDD